MRRNHVAIALAVTLLFALVGCGGKGPPAPGPIRGSGPNTCPLDEVTWLEVVEGYDKNETVELLAELKAAAEADKDALAANADIGAAYKRVVEQRSSRTFRVSQETLDLTVRLRQIACDVLAGVFGEDVSKARDAYISLATSAGDAKKKVEESPAP